MKDKKKVYICVSEREYGRRLLRFINARHHPLLDLEWVSDIKKMNHISATGDECYILSDVDIASATDTPLIRLDDKTDVTKQTIRLYQRADRIYADLLKVLSLSDDSSEINHTTSSPVRGMYGILPLSDTAGDIVCTLLTKKLSSYGQTLYINMSALPYFLMSEDVGVDDGYHLGELIFLMRAKDFPTTLRAARIKQGDAYRLPAAYHYKDLTDCGSDEWISFLDKITETGEYDYVVINTGSLSKSSFPILEKCVRTYTVGGGDTTDTARFDILKRYMDTDTREALSDRMEYFIPPCDIAEIAARMVTTDCDEWFMDDDINHIADGII